MSIYISGMSRLPDKKRVQILGMLVEGMSLRAASRLSGCGFNTVTKLLVHVGKACEAYHDEHARPDVQAGPVRRNKELHLQ